MYGLAYPPRRGPQELINCFLGEKTGKNASSRLESPRPLVFRFVVCFTTSILLICSSFLQKQLFNIRTQLFSKQLFRCSPASGTRRTTWSSFERLRHPSKNCKLGFLCRHRQWLSPKRSREDQQRLRLHHPHLQEHS